MIQKQRKGCCYYYDYINIYLLIIIYMSTFLIAPQITTASNPRRLGCLDTVIRTRNNPWSAIYPCVTLNLSLYFSFTYIQQKELERGATNGTSEINKVPSAKPCKFVNTTQSATSQTLLQHLRITLSANKRNLVIQTLHLTRLANFPVHNHHHSLQTPTFAIPNKATHILK